MEFVYGIGEEAIPYPRTRMQIANSKPITFASSVVRSLGEALRVSPVPVTVGVARDELVRNVHALGDRGYLHGEVYYSPALIKSRMPDLDNLLAYNLNRNNGKKYDDALREGFIFETMPRPIRADAKAEYLFYRSESKDFLHYELEDPILNIEFPPKLGKEDIELYVSGRGRATDRRQLAISIQAPSRMSSNYLKVIIDGVMDGLFGNRPGARRNIVDPPDSLDRLVAIRMFPGEGSTRVEVNPVKRVIYPHVEIGQSS
ncbi:hypothetical protein L3N51_01465 [Metallosphaera sp. J1]|uniref:hypothetical protein n=1 Tax=Metallosphaera javensis (ex Hofmann et al. 2022) TaxID=99938 RepID=UPI001EDF6442|nr:hypothetical protein [Metallosphaera javensis (ex Hofmann et al. 2022)]MCG3109175.1 hypothetical protein [Metallosphaera javensis (ex Hofmann et al. 2022)]